MMIGTPSTPKVTPELQRKREAFYAELPEFNMRPLWAILKDAMTPEPMTQAVPPPPCGAGHAAGNGADVPMLWLDGLDMPFVQSVDAMFFEYYPELTQPLRREVDDSIRRYGSNLLPAFERPIGEGLYSPVLNYRWKDARASLEAAKGDQGSPYDGVIFEYTNPYTGGPSLPTMSSCLQLVRKGEHTKAHRHVSSAVYHVAEGRGYSIIRGERFDWEESDTFVVPAWSWHEHASAGGDAVLYSFNDRPILKPFGLEREQVHPKGRQE